MIGSPLAVHGRHRLVPYVAPTSCTSACNGTHPKFDVDAGDRALRTFSEAIELAARRAVRRRRKQVVRRHAGWVIRSGVWFIQDERP